MHGLLRSEGALELRGRVTAPEIQIRSRSLPSPRLRVKPVFLRWEERAITDERSVSTAVVARTAPVGLYRR